MLPHNSAVCEKLSLRCGYQCLPSTKLTSASSPIRILVKMPQQRQLAGKVWVPPQRLHAGPRRKRVKTQSDLHGDMQRQPEMSARPPVAGHTSNSRDVMKLQ